MAESNRRSRRLRYATIGATLGRYRSSLNTPDVENWLRERQPDDITNQPELSSQDGNTTQDDSEGLFSRFDRMEELNPGMFDTFLEQLTKWGLKKLATNLKKECQDACKDQECESTTVQESKSRASSIKSTTSADGDENVVVTIPGQNNVVHLHMHNAVIPAGDEELQESNREPRRRDPNREQQRERQNEESHHEPDNERRGRNCGRDGGGFFEHVEQDPSLEQYKPLTKIAEKRLKNSVRGAYKVTDLADHSDGTKECLLSFKAPSIILHRRVFRNNEGYAFNKGGETYLCVSTLVRSLDTGREKKDGEKEAAQ
ncbi:uncharacterized protein [Amphiura filiformis]|uniref:uncharacterized protein n=1 Tax=Amphiura filiformis TaxID=82378 RepID=UPI003B21718D